MPPREKLERLGLMVAELRKRQAKAAFETRGYRDEDGIWQGGLMAFVIYFWPILEPEAKLVKGMVLEAICEHLEAVTFGEITRLLINVFPGSMKSLLTEVFWPAWEAGPMDMAHLRYVTFSYSARLTERDNGRYRDLIMSVEYQEMYSDRVTLVKIGDQKISNAAKGWKIASSVGGVGTGERGDRVICLPYNAMIQTEIGAVAIGDLVTKRLAVRIGALDHSHGLQWQRIEEYETNPGSETVEIEYDGGRLRCTVDHPVYIEGRGYVRADQVEQGEKLWSILPYAMQELRRDDRTQAELPQGFLQQAVPNSLGESGRFSQEQSTVHRVFEDGLPYPGASCPASGSGVLQPQVPWTSQSWREQSSLSNGFSDANLRVVRQVLSTEPQRSQAFKVLLNVLRLKFGMVQIIADRADKALSAMFSGVQASASRCGVLLQALRKCGAFQENSWVWQWPLCPWCFKQEISPRLEYALQGVHPRTRWGQVHGLHSGAFERQELARSPHRLRERELGRVQSDNDLPLLPRQDARQSSVPSGLERAVVRSVRKAGYCAETFNIRVASCHNYFANGVLVHNCDDPHNVKEAESDVVRNTTVQWFREAMSNRLNNPETGAIVIIMQRVHEDDVSGVILSLGLPYTHLMIPMEYDPDRQVAEDGSPVETTIGWTDPRYDPDDIDGSEGALAWPERFSPKVVQTTKHEVGPFAWASQYQQTPQVRGGGLFQRAWWQLWDPPDGKFPPLEYVVASLDSAFTEKEENDPSALTVWGVYRNELGNRRIILVHAWRKRLRFRGPTVERYPKENEMVYRQRAQPSWGLIEWVADTCRRFKVDRLLIEAKASGISAAQELRRQHGREGWAIELVNPKGDKVARALAVQPTFSQGMIYAPVRDWSEMVINEMSVFPKGKNDDLTDATTQALKHLRDNGLANSEEEEQYEIVESLRQKPQPKSLYPV